MTEERRFFIWHDGGYITPPNSDIVGFIRDKSVQINNVKPRIRCHGKSTFMDITGEFCPFEAALTRKVYGCITEAMAHHIRNEYLKHKALLRSPNRRIMAVMGLAEYEKIHRRLITEYETCYPAVKDWVQ